MIRFAWLQSRTQTAVLAAGVAVVAVIGAVTGPSLAHIYASTVAGCRAVHTCQSNVQVFSNNDYALYGALGLLVLVVPAIAGVFWGAPLVARELESGTLRLAWTQSVGRRRWLGTKIAVLGLSSMAAAGLLSLAVSWSARSIDLAKANQFRYFDQRDVVPIGYAAFAFCLGVVIGLLVRRVLPALAATLAAFIAARFVVEQWVRPHLAAVTHVVVGLRDAGGLGFTDGPVGPVFHAEPAHIQNADVLGAQLVDRAGRPVGGTALHQFLAAHCPAILQATGSVPGPGPAGSQAVKASAGSVDAFNSCVGQLSTAYHQSVAYIAPGRYWTVQWIEMGLFLVAALALAGLAMGLIRRVQS